MSNPIIESIRGGMGANFHGRSNSDESGDAVGRSGVGQIDLRQSDSYTAGGVFVDEAGPNGAAVTMQSNQAARFMKRTRRPTDGVLMRRGNRSCFALAMFLLAFSFGSSCSTATASPQLPIFPKPSVPDQPNDDLQRLPMDRRVVRQLAELEGLAKKAKPVEFLALLDGLRSADPALMVPGAGGSFVPLHRELAMAVQDVSPEILKELNRDDVVAASALSLAIESHGRSEHHDGLTKKGKAADEPVESHALIQVLHRFAGTDTAWKAHLYLAAIHADRGHQQLAMFWLAPLMTPKSPAEWKAAAEKLSRVVTERASVPNSGRPSSEPTPSNGRSEGAIPGAIDSNKAADPVPDDSNKIDAVNGEDVKGNEATQAANEQNSDVANADAKPSNAKTPDDANGESPKSDDSVPLVNVRWMQSLPISAQAKRRSQDLVQSAPKQRLLPWSAWEPVVDEDRVYIRTPHLISAYDHRSGNHLWTRTINTVPEPVEELDNGFPPFRVPMNERAVNDGTNAPEILSLHRNEMVGRMTADSERLFAVCQVSIKRSDSSRPSANQLRFILGRTEQMSGGIWELVAIEKSTGRRLWTMGGLPVESRFGNELAMAWFAGPPAVSGSQLYGVVEHSGAIQLTCLSASTGHLNWMIPLVFPDTAIGLDTPRQLLSAWIRAESGLIITTTTTGWMIAVDSMTRSVLWARRLPNSPSPAPVVRQGRNPVIFQSPLYPFAKTWRSGVPVLSNDSVVFAGSESSQLMVLESATGKIRYRSSADNATVILYADSERVVVSSSNSIMALQCPKMQRAWSKPRKSDEPIPVGRAVKSGESLLIPLSDGSIEVRDLNSGNAKTKLAGLRPAFSSGGLYSFDDKIISHAPDHLAMMSSDPSDQAEFSDPLQQALFLLETGRFQEAKAAVEKVQVHAMNGEAIRRLNFRIAVSLSTRKILDPETGLREISTLARTNNEKALSEFLRLDRFVSTSSDTAFPILAAALQSNDSILSTTIPDPSKLYETLRSSNAEEPLVTNSLVPGSESVRRPLRSWIFQQMRRLLRDADAGKKLEMVQSLHSLPDEVLLEMHSGELTSEYLRRAEFHVQAGTWSESTLHMLMAVVSETVRQKEKNLELQEQDIAGRLAAMFDTMDSQSGNRFSRDSAQQAMVQRLLLVKRHELLSALKVDNLAPIESARDALRKRWSEFKDRSYSMVPVNSNGQIMARSANLLPIEVTSDDDLFLTAYHWTHRHEPGGLIAESILNPTLPSWIMRTSTSAPNVSMSDDEISRQGTVIIFKKLDGLSAFSVVDQRWLWHRQMPTGLPRRLNSFADRPFAEFNAFARAQMVSGRNQGVCGGNDGWICFLNEGTLEVVDLLTGHALWEVSGVASSGLTVACDAFVLSEGMSGGTKVNSDPIEGTATEVAAAMRPADVASIICGAGNAVAVWNDRERTVSIDWLNPETDEVVRSVPLTDMKFAHFMDSETIVSVTGQQTFTVVNLRSGSSQTLNYATENGALADSSSLSIDKIRVAADAVNYYVFERSNEAPRMLPSLYALRAETASKMLCAVDRQSGKVAWSMPLRNDALVCFEPSTTSALLSVTVNDRRGANQGVFPNNLAMPQRYEAGGVSRLTGTSLFTYPIVAQYPTGNFRLAENSAGQLDLDALGNRVRYLPVDKASNPEQN